MNLKQVMHGEFLSANYLRFNNETGEFFPSKVFKYKTYDDAQLYERRTSPQQGNLSSKFSLSIKTTADLPFKAKDKIITLVDNRVYEITGVQKLQNTPLIITNLMFPSAKGNVPTLIHLNKDDV